MIDTNIIYNAFIKAVREALPDELSDIGSPANPLPAVIREKGASPKPDYPYVTVNIDGITDVVYRESAQGIADDDVWFSATHKRLPITFMIYDKDDSSSSRFADALGIANKLHARLARSPSTYHQIVSEANGKIEQVFDVESLETRLQTEYLDVALFTLNYVTTDILKDPNAGQIETISLEGKTVLEKAPEGDTSTQVDYTITIDATP